MNTTTDRNGDGDRDDDEPIGVCCPDCNCRHCFVIYTRPRTDQRGGKTIRRRECRNCGRRFLTTERVVG